MPTFLPRILIYPYQPEHESASNLVFVDLTDNAETTSRPSSASEPTTARDGLYSGLKLPGDRPRGCKPRSVSWDSLEMMPSHCTSTSFELVPSCCGPESRPHRSCLLRRVIGMRDLFRGITSKAVDRHADGMPPHPTFDSSHSGLAEKSRPHRCCPVSPHDMDHMTTTSHISRKAGLDYASSSLLISSRPTSQG